MSCNSEPDETAEMVKDLVVQVPYPIKTTVEVRRAAVVPDPEETLTEAVEVPHTEETNMKVQNPVNTLVEVQNSEVEAPGPKRSTVDVCLPVKVPDPGETNMEV